MSAFPLETTAGSERLPEKTWWSDGGLAAAGAVVLFLVRGRRPRLLVMVALLAGALLFVWFEMQRTF